MQKLKIFIALLFMAIVMMPQLTLLSMEQHQDQIIYLPGDRRIVNGQLQEVVRHEYKNSDGTISVIEEWIPKQ